MVHFIEFKFGKYIAGHRWMNPIEFGEYQINSFFTGVQKKNSYTLWPMESNSSKCPSIQTVHSTELKLGMYIIGHSSTHCVDFGEFRFNSFFNRSTKKRILIN